MNHQPGTSRFDIGSITIDYNGAILSDLPNGISDNLYVEVYSTAGIVGGVLVASKVEREDDGSIDYQGYQDDEYEVHGIVMAIDSNSITVNSQTCIITADTIYEDGNTNINVGDMAEIEGYFNAAGDMICEEIELEDDESTSEMYATVGSVVAPQPNVGTITLMDSTVVHVNADTIMHDDRDDNGMMPVQNFNLQDLAANDYVELYVYANGDGSFTATKVEREDTPAVP